MKLKTKIKRHVKKQSLKDRLVVLDSPEIKECGGLHEKIGGVTIASRDDVIMTFIPGYKNTVISTGNTIVITLDGVEQKLCCNECFYQYETDDGDKIEQTKDKITITAKNGETIVRSVTPDISQMN